MNSNETRYEGRDTVTDQNALTDQDALTDRALDQHEALADHEQADRVQADHEQADREQADRDQVDADRSGPFGATTTIGVEKSTPTGDSAPFGTARPGDFVAVGATEADVVEVPDLVGDPASVKDPISAPASAASEPTGPALTPLTAAAKGVDTEGYELQGRFVDDPAAAVKEAVGRVEQALAELRTQVETGSTEDLRVAFRRFRDLHSALH